MEFTDFQHCSTLPGFTFTSNNCDDEDILKQMRMLYCRSNRIVRLFNKCSKLVLLELCRSFCTVFHCPYIWTKFIRKLPFQRYELHITSSIGRSWVCLNDLRLLLCLSLTTFLILKLFIDRLFIHLLLEYQFHGFAQLNGLGSWKQSAKCGRKKCTSKRNTQSFVYFYYWYIMLYLFFCIHFILSSLKIDHWQQKNFERTNTHYNIHL